MKHSAKQRFYLLATLVGALVPSYFTWLFCVDKVAELGGLSVGTLLMLSKEFYVDAFKHVIASQLLTDVLIASIVYFVWLFHEGRRLGMQHLWVYPLLTYMVAFSFGMPLFMYFRERRLSERAVE